jgi:hypothetical protein
LFQRAGIGQTEIATLVVEVTLDLPRSTSNSVVVQSVVPGRTADVRGMSGSGSVEHENASTDNPTVGSCRVDSVLQVAGLATAGDSNTARSRVAKVDTVIHVGSVLLVHITLRIIMAAGHGKRAASSGVIQAGVPSRHLTGDESATEESASRT